MIQKILLPLFLGLPWLLTAQTLQKADAYFDGTVMFYEYDPALTPPYLAVLRGTMGGKQEVVRQGEQSYTLDTNEVFIGKTPGKLYTMWRPRGARATTLRAYDREQGTLKPSTPTRVLPEGARLMGVHPYRQSAYFLLNGACEENACGRYAVLNANLDTVWNYHTADSRQGRQMVHAFFDKYLVLVSPIPDSTNLVTALLLNLETKQHIQQNLRLDGLNSLRCFLADDVLLINTYNPNSRKSEVAAFDFRLQERWRQFFSLGAFSGAGFCESTNEVILLGKRNQCYRVHRKTGALTEVNLGVLIDLPADNQRGYNLIAHEYVELKKGRGALIMRNYDRKSDDYSNAYVILLDKDFQKTDWFELSGSNQRNLTIKYLPGKMLFVSHDDRVFKLEVK